MKKIIPLLFLSALLLFAVSCSTFVKENEAEKLVKFEKTDDQFIDYILLNDVKTGDHLIKKGEKVRIIITVGGDWIKVYVYRADEDRLLSRRNLALYLFEDDFPDKKYSPDFLREKIYEVVRPLQ